MRVVLSGYYGFHNVGDEAILQAIITALRKKNKDIEITVLSNDPDYTKGTYTVDAVDRWQMSEVMNAIRQADGVISGGGSLLQDKTGMKTVPYYIVIMMIAYFFGKPFFIYAQGIGPLQRKLSQKLVKFAISKAKYISVRDQESLQLLEKIGVRQPIDLVPDPVMGMTYKKGLNKSWLTKEGLTSPFITVAIREWPTSTNFAEKVIKALDDCAKNGQKIVFLPMHGEDDDETSREWASRMNADVAIFPYDATISEKISLIGDSTLLVGMRLHALIFAAIANTPMVGISYDPKIDSFINQIDQPLIGNVNGDWTPEQLYEMIQDQLQNHQRQATLLKEQAKPLQQNANETAQKVLSLINKSK